MIRSENNYLLLFAFCKVVKGVEKSIICDLQKEKIKFIPNEMGKTIKMLEEQPFEVVKDYFKEDADIFNSYVKFLLDEGFAFYARSKENFIDIEDHWMSPEIINNAIIEYDFESYNLQNVLIKLDNLLTKFIEIRFTIFDRKHIPEFEAVLKYSSNSVLRNIRLFIPYVCKELCQKIIELVNSYSIVDSVVFYESKWNKSIEKNEQETFFITQTLEDITKSNIEKKFLINSIDHYYECQKYNPYYNKKVAISESGEIKNCIKNRAVFGNVNKDDIATIVESENFQEFWHVTHDQIIDVQNSELRYNYIITNDLKKTNDGEFKIIA